MEADGAKNKIRGCSDTKKMRDRSKLTAEKKGGSAHSSKKDPEVREATANRVQWQQQS